MKTKRLHNLGLLLFTLLHEANPASPIAQQMIAAHNFYRTKVGTPPLAWSDDLATSAQQWAATLIDRGTFAPRQGGQFGENLFEISGGSADPSRVVDAWASEAANYDHTTNSCRARCGHYTQLVWRGTRLVARR